MTAGVLVTFSEQYNRALGDFLVAFDEDARLRAYELGRQALQKRMGLLDVVTIHHLALDAFLQRAGGAMSRTRLARAGEFLRECLGPFEMSQLGYLEANQGLHRMNEMLQKQNVELEKANRAKDLFLATMSHELRTPLNAIIGFTGMLLMLLAGPLSATQEEHLKTIQASAKHLLSLINDLLDVAKIESGKVQLAFEPVDCVEVVRQVAETLRPLAEQKGLGFRIDTPAALTIGTDRRALHQIIINLVNNAIKFTERGEIVVRLAREGQRTELSVTDTGPGIREADRAKLFQAFSQMDDGTTRRHEGTGLGLYLSQKLAGLLHGELYLTSREGEGSRFTLRLE